MGHTHSLESQWIVLKQAGQLKVPQEVCPHWRLENKGLTTDCPRPESSGWEQIQDLLQYKLRAQAMPCCGWPGMRPLFHCTGRVPCVSELVSLHWSIVRFTLVWGRRSVCLQETRVLHYSLAIQMLKRTKKGSLPHHSVSLECVCQKTAGEAEAGGAKASSPSSGQWAGGFPDFLPWFYRSDVPITDDGSRSLFFSRAHSSYVLVLF